MFKTKFRMLIGVAAAALAFGTSHATIVTIETPVGTFEVDLFEEEAPNTVANFLSYVNDGDYTNSFMHRTVPGFVVQGGGYIFDTSGPDNRIEEVPGKGTIQNEFGVSNTRGTIAMALVGSDIDSAQSQWFINVVDNSATLDSQSFTVFGEVLGDGMQVVDRIANINNFNFGGAFTSMPLLGYTGSGNLTEEMFVKTTVTEGPKALNFNRGVSGAWFNVDTAGQGWLIDVIDDGELQSVFVAWFTYDSQEPAEDETAGFASSQHRWFTASGEFDGNVAELDIFLSTGGVFNDPRETGLTQVGTMRIELESCTTATMTFDFDEDNGLDAELPITRLTPPDLCESLRLNEI